MRTEKHGAGIQGTEKSTTFVAQMVFGCPARVFGLKRESGGRPEQNPLLYVLLPDAWKQKEVCHILLPLACSGREGVAQGTSQKTCQL